MFIACPHCHELVATRPQSRQSPELCPRCGGALQMPPDAETTAPAMPVTPSFASLLRGTETAAADPPPAQATGPDTAASAKPETGTETETETESPAPAPLSVPVAQAPARTAGSDADETQTGAVPKAETESEPPSPPADADTATGQATASGAEPADDGADALASGEEGAAPSAVVTPLAGQTATRSRGPSFTRSQRTTQVQTATAKGQWWVLGALSLLLLIQVLLADRARLAMNASWRPLLVSMCGVLRCSLPPWREPEAFVMLSRDVRPVIGAPGTLQAQASFRNDARWPQPWPVLLLTLKDADGRTLGARALLPAEYLDASVDGSEIAAGQSAQVAVRIREPSANVVAYSFDFR